jgi:hypothetical protein
VSTASTEAWVNAEDRCFQYLLEKLDATETGNKVRGYKGELPRTLLSENKDLAAWYFAIERESELIMVRATEAPLETWRFSAGFRGLFIERDVAQRTWGNLMDALPIARGTLAGITKFRAMPGTNLRREIMQLDNDLAHGGPTRVWALEVPLEVVFTNTPTGG